MTIVWNTVIALHCICVTRKKSNKSQIQQIPELAKVHILRTTVIQHSGSANSENTWHFVNKVTTL